MSKALASQIHARALRAEAAALAGNYLTPPSAAERSTYQLSQLNARWAELVKKVPYYRDLALERGLPAHWPDLDAFIEQVPTTTRATLQDESTRLISEDRPPDEWVATGGSTAAPVQLPRWNQELIDTRANTWVGRAWYGVEPDDRLFLLWGHSHLLGTGLRGWLNGLRRRLFDRLLGYHRFSAYDISEPAMERAVAALLAFKPSYVIGYSVALDRLARAAAPERARLHALGIKTIIATAEGFPHEDSAARLEDAFGCPVSMEYGAVEALSIAYTHPDGGYRLFWRSYLAEAERQDGRWVLRLTSLYPRSLPLIRYELGDTVELPAGSTDHVVGLTHFDRVAGRCNDAIEMQDGQLVHSEAISHAVRLCPAIRGYQVVQKGAEIRLLYVAEEALPDDQRLGLMGRLAAIHPEFAEISIESTNTLAQSIAGKTPMVVRAPADS
jgi:phenylacetate-coenzyme A ligase PaaK-like adenylate-forming protein